MPRTTLKLPHKSTSLQSDARLPTRKPIRGGSQAAKRSTAWRAKDPAPIPASPPVKAAETSIPRVHGNTTAARQQSEEAKVANKPASAPPRANDQKAAAAEAGSKDDSGVKGRFAGRTEHVERPPKPTYPARGIARSTGVRAALPERTVRAELPPARTDSNMPASAAGFAAQQTSDQPPTASDRARGLSKESPRLAKFVSQLAPCSRREADAWIENGWVSVDGVVVTRLGARVSPKAKITIKEIARRQPIESVTIVFNKPLGNPAAPADAACEAVATTIRPDNHWREDLTSQHFQATHLRRLAAAGKLAGEEHGMLVFTQEGSVARRLTGGDARLEKEYHLRVEGGLPPDALERLRHGLSLDGVRLERAQVSWLSEQQLRFVVHDNRKRRIQCMCELLGLRVTDVKRVRIGSVSLGRLPPGKWRYLRVDERF